MWILLLVLVSYPGGQITATTAEFASRSKCLDATLAISTTIGSLNDNSRHTIVASLSCVEKG